MENFIQKKGRNIIYEYIELDIKSESLYALSNYKIFNGFKYKRITHDYEGSYILIIWEKLFFRNIEIYFDNFIRKFLYLKKV